VIGSTPESIAESLQKIELKDKAIEGAQIFAIAIFAAAVNKPTLETFLADARFANIRPLLTSALSIQGRANMTAITLLGHCFLTSEMASDVVFATEFRKKMGQDHLWDGSLEQGSLSDKQRGIMKEKKRVTDPIKAKALASGFLKWTGLLGGAFTDLEASLFNIQTTGSVSESKKPARAESAESSPSGSPSRSIPRAVTFRISDTKEASIPENVYLYRKNIMGMSDSEIIEIARSMGESEFIKATEKLIRRDPDGTKVKAQSTIAGASK